MNGKIKVLLVDDHALFRVGIRRLLSFYDDFEVIGEAGNGEEAIHTAAEAVPDVILMDIDMPGCGGVSATTSIRTQCPNCRILLLTGHRRYIVTGLRAGASGYVLKEADEQAIQRRASRFFIAGGVDGFVEFNVDLNKWSMEQDPNIPWDPNAKIIQLGVHYATIGFPLNEPGVNPTFFDAKGNPK